VEEEVEEVEQAALLHDIGKMGIPDSILRKPGPLDEEERELMREHPGIGERIVGSVEGLSHLAPVIRAEHERRGGKGYPDGLSGEEIPLASRIAFSCDAFHAMTSDRPYRKAMGVPAALAELESNAGTQSCPRVVRALLEVVVGAP
jgi:HD-GYP domain-containing protein (c-di-GMP phosphodiesterase class II)